MNRKPTDERADIVMLMTDQHAARIMGCAGDPAVHTPALDRLAKQGTRFENCYCPSPLCVPSRMAFLTGLEPHQSGVLTNDDYLPSDVPTIAHAMGAAGYECHLVGRMHFYGPDQHHGFTNRPIGDIGASYPGAPAPDIGPLTKGRGNRGPDLEHSGAGETSYQAYDQAVIDHAHRCLAEARAQKARTGRPFFLLVSLFCPHPPYIARRSDYDRYIGMLPPPRLKRPATDHPAIEAWREAGQTDDVSDQAIAKSRAAYYGLVTMVDRLAGSLFDALAGDENTLCIYASDHGESLGERGLWWKSTFFDESVKVPLIVRGPGFESGVIDKRIVNLMDVSATLLATAQAANLPGHTGHDLRQTEDWLDQTISGYYGGLMNITLPPLRHRMLRTDRYKLMWFDGHHPMLFDMADDPDELHDVARDSDHSNVLEHLTTSILDGWDTAAIARQQALGMKRNRVIRNWVSATSPSEPMRWYDPDRARNAYE